MSATKISVAMTTYNGEKYLLKQLDSLLAQTRSVDELIACDDGSQDHTAQLFGQYIKDNGLEKKWKFVKNKINLGVMKNFIHAASLCTGDIIFFCDQDDEWDINKVQIMVEVFESHPDAKVVSCSEAYIDSNGKLLEGKSRFYREKDMKNALVKVTFTNQIKTMHSPGLTIAFRRSFIEETKVLTYDEDLTYDITMGLVASVKGGMYRLYKPLVYRRIHDANYSSPELSLSARVKNYNHHVFGRELQLHHMRVIAEKYDSFMSPSERRNLHKRIKNTEKTVTYLKAKNVIGLISLCFSMNPMDNYKLNVGNVLIALVAKMKMS